MIADLDYIPKNWKKIKIPKVLFFQEGPGVRNWQFTDKGIKLLNVGNINNGKVDLNKTKIYLSEEEATGTYKHFLVDEGDLLIACSGIVVDNFHNKIAFAEKEHLPLCLNTSTMRFKALNDEVDLNYFKYYLQTIHFTAQLRKLITGSAQLNFGPSHIKKIDVLLPPIETQKRISQILDDAAALRDKTRQLIKEYDALAQSIFLDMFGDTWTNPKNWKICNVEDVAKKEKYSIKAGPFGSALKKEFYSQSGYKIYGQEQVIKDDFDYGDYYINDALFQNFKNCEISSGDILISLVGTFGKIAIVPRIFEKGIINPRLMKISPDPNIIESVFFKKILQSDGVKMQLEFQSRGQTMGVLNLAIIRKIKIPVPPIDLQNQFIEKIALIEHQKELAKQELKESEDLFNCLLQKAFKGELV